MCSGIQYHAQGYVVLRQAAVHNNQLPCRQTCEHYITVCDQCKHAQQATVAPSAIMSLQAQR